MAAPTCPFCGAEKVCLHATYMASAADDASTAIECGVCGACGPVASDDATAWQLWKVRFYPASVLEPMDG